MKDRISPDRGAGILMAVSSLPSHYGIGTLGATARNFIDTLTDVKMRYWQMLPVGPTSFGNSPYQPISAFAGNNYLIDLDELTDMGLLDPEKIRSYDWGDDADDVDYSSMYNNRVKVLKDAFAGFDRNDPDYISFKEKNSHWLTDYSLFRTIKELNKGREWVAWDTPLRDRDKKALDGIREKYGDTISFYDFCQYMFDRQWQELHSYARGKGVALIGDIPLYVAHDSADVWAHREIFQLKEDGRPALVSAMPSDEFSPKGQIWGNPVYDWEMMDKDDFSWWRARVKRAASMYDFIRLDHFIGAVRYYAVSPDSTSSESGRWYKGPSRKFIDSICDCTDSTLIVDDAGPKTMVPGVKKLIDKWGLISSRILVFGWEKGADSDNLPHNYQNNEIAVYTTTHDTETMTGYIGEGKENAIDYMSRYMDLGITFKRHHGSDKVALTSEQIHVLSDASIRLAYSSNALLAIIPMQDILGLGNDARMNAPSTIVGNWQWRVGTHILTEERRHWLRDLAFTYRR